MTCKLERERERERQTCRQRERHTERETRYNCEVIILFLYFHSYKLMQECWMENPNDRPTFADLRSQFDALLTKDNPYIQFENINAHMPYYNSHHSQHNSHSDDERTLGISTSDFEFSSSSSMTMNGATASGYDYLKPVLRQEPPPQDPHSNPYVETPTSSSSKCHRLSTYEDEEGTKLADIDSSLDELRRSVQLELQQLDADHTQAEA